MGIINDCRIKTYLSGGSVRDKLLGIKSKTYNYTAVAYLSFRGFIKIVNKEGKIHKAWPNYLAVKAKLKNKDVNIVMARTDEEYRDGRHPDDVMQTRSLKEDSLRRDFTINAMYMGDNGKIYDFHNGRQHLKEKKIVCIGNPQEKFKEDYTRILRAMRLSSQLNFSIDRSTLIAMGKVAHNIHLIEPNILRNEINKSLEYDSVKTLKMLNHLDIWDVLKSNKLNLFLSTKEVRCQQE